MPDILDRAEDEMAFLENIRQATRLTAPPHRESAYKCIDCNHDIDGRRRQALPGVQTCPECQTLREEVTKNWERQNRPYHFR